MVNTDVDFKKVSIKQANANAELSYQLTQYEVLTEALQTRVAELEAELAEAKSAGNKD